MSDFVWIIIGIGAVFAIGLKLPATQFAGIQEIEVEV